MITSATNSTTESGELKLLLFHIKSYPYFNQMSCRWNSHDWKTYIWLRTYRSLIFCPAWLQERYVVIYLIPYRKKNVEPAPVARSTIQRPSHCPVSRNEQRESAPRKVCIQQNSLTKGHTFGCPVSMICVITTPYKGRSRCFVLDWLFEVAKFLNRQNQSVQKTPFSICSFLPAGKGHFRRWRYVSLRYAITTMTSFAQTFYRHNEHWACILCGCYSVYCSFDLRFICPHYHPSLQAMSPSDRLEGGSRWLSHARWCCDRVALQD